MTRRLITSDITAADRLAGTLQGFRPSRARGWLGRWLDFLAAAWLPNRNPTIGGH